METPVQFAISSTIPLKDVCMALTLVAGKPRAPQQEYTNINMSLLNETHETVFAKALEIAKGNGRQIFVSVQSYKEYLADYDGRDAVFLSQPEYRVVIGAYVEGNLVAPSAEISPDAHQDQKLFVLTAMGIAQVN